MIEAAAMLVVLMPDPQKRSMVTPLALMSYPASLPVEQWRILAPVLAG